jgi:hypothetical protein
VTGLKAKMKNKLLPLREKILLRKRSIIETGTVNLTISGEGDKVVPIEILDF